jgi:flagellar basal-body rod protein FlgG
MKALAIAATGMSAQQTNLEVIANNVANINTTGFKRARAEFADLFYQIDRAPGVSAISGQLPVPEGIRYGLGVRTVAVRNLHEQGPLKHTENPLDLAINGDGYFPITGPEGETVYTRAGTFNLGPNGELVTIDGFQVQPGITIPPEAKNVSINKSGDVYISLDGSTQDQLVGTLQIARFANKAGLEPMGDNLFRETTASGQAQLGTASTEDYGSIHQGYIEESNVDPVKEITDLISAQRAYEMNSKVITAADEMSRTISTGMR